MFSFLYLNRRNKEACSGKGSGNYIAAKLKVHLNQIKQNMMNVN